MRHDALEAVSVAENPVGHVSAVAGAQRAFPVFINERVSLLCVVEALHQVFKRSAAPVAVDGVDELLSVAGGAVEVDHEDHVSTGGEEFGIPAVAPLVSPLALRAAVDEELDRIFLAGVEPGWLDEEAFHAVAVGARERDGFGWRKVNLC